MRILFICHRFPFPPNRGGKIRPFHMIEHLSRKHTVVVASLAHSAKELEAGAGLRGHCAEIIAEVVPSPARWMRAGKALFSPTPSSLAYFWSPRLHCRVQEAWKNDRFDAVMVHCAFMAPYAMTLPGGFHVLDYGDLDSAKWFDYARYRRFPLSLGYAVEARKLRRFERNAARRFDCCTVTTQGELEEFQTLGVSVPCRVIPNGVDASYFRPRSSQTSDSRVIAFQGRMDYFPNVDGISDFARNVFPKIRKSEPKAELRIIGSNPVREVRVLAQLPGVTVTGYVPDVRPYLEDAAVSVAPLRIARGTQNKILQCMAMGIPVVATPEAARGIQAVPGEHLCVAQGPDEFARQVARLLQDHEFRRSLSEAGRRQVEEAHRWSRSLKILDGILDDSKDAAQDTGATQALGRMIKED
jgi:sugar transferase (PEP-CTERM/EpsH1 system associated)